MPRTPRKSLTQEGLAEPEAIELLTLLQTVTEDGRVLDEEIEALNEWLLHNATSTLPAVAYLRESVEAVLEDGRITAEERVWLQKALETVMPREDREFAKMRRREAKADDLREAAEEEALAQEAVWKVPPLARFSFMVAGVLHEGRADIVCNHCRVEDEVFLVRDPRNRYSSNAILVRLLSKGLDLGHVPESEAVRLARLLDRGALQSASVKKLVAGRRAPVPVIWGELYPADSLW